MWFHKQRQGIIKPLSIWKKLGSGIQSWIETEFLQEEPDRLNVSHEVNQWYETKHISARQQGDTFQSMPERKKPPFKFYSCKRFLYTARRWVQMSFRGTAQDSPKRIWGSQNSLKMGPSKEWHELTSLRLTLSSVPYTHMFVLSAWHVRLQNPIKLHSDWKRVGDFSQQQN